VLSWRRTYLETSLSAFIALLERTIGRHSTSAATRRQAEYRGQGRDVSMRLYVAVHAGKAGDMKGDEADAQRPSSDAIQHTAAFFTEFNPSNAHTLTTST